MQLFTRTDSKTTAATIKLFWREMRQNKKIVISYSILVPLSNMLYAIILPLLFSFIIQNLLTDPHAISKSFWLLGIGVVISIIGLCANFIGFQLLFQHEERLRTRLVERATNNLLSHSYQFFSNRKVGTLAGDFTGFVNAIIGLLDTIFLQASGILVNFIASLIIIAVLSPILLLPLGFLTTLLIVLSVRAYLKRAPLRNKRKLLVSRMNGLVADILGNQMLVRVFAREPHEQKAVTTARQEIQDLSFREINVIQRESIIRYATVIGFQIVTIAFCVWLFSLNTLSIAALIFTVTYLGRVASTLFAITPVIRGLEQTFLDAAPMTAILLEPVEVVDAEDARELIVHKGAIDFQQVTFRYEDSKDKDILNDFSLHIQPGEKIGLAGPSGGGKTTLTKLLLRFVDIQAGAITIDSQDIAKVTQSSLRSQIAYIPQEPFLFHRSLRENIAYGKEDATDEEIIAATKLAYAYEFIQKLPDGLDTTVGERGVKLSGGQRQRIAIARAILKDAPILVLDEATSALDSESELYIQQALEQLMKDRTTIVIAHRLSTIQKMDRIVVLNDGKIEEDDTHKKLLQNKKLYAKLWAHQSGGFIED